jgi:hypothetical protein
LLSAKAKGAYILTTSTSNLECIAALGADRELITKLKIG